MFVRKKHKALMLYSELCELLGTLLGERNFAVVDNINDKIIALGELLAQFDNIGVGLIEQLEDIAKKIIILQEEISNGRVNQMMQQVLRRKLYKFHEVLVHDIPDDRILKFFLPYNASMWDSLESVWMDAAADPACDAIVMPIPYYDKNPDGSIREWHWEGEKLPENVPIVDFRTVDLKQVQPDEIYIHNPYDDNNYVTSVAPEYYSYNLKECTNKLVYIPYYVTNVDTITTETIKGYAMQKVWLYADCIILEADKVKKLYVDYLSQLYGEDKREYFENKIKATGSPKIDKAKRTKINWDDIPSDWLSKIKKEDGTMKKVIMYGSGLSDVLQYGEKLLDKIENSFEYFKSKTDTIAILWRPHPLIPSTIYSMRPELATRYEAIVEKYKKEDWGIYDETGDLHRSIALSDAYYGDDSSILNLFRELKKPVMIEDVDIMN